LWIGAAKNSENKPCNINWSSVPIKALGIYFGHNHDQCTILNWDNKLDTCKQKINNWSKRNLTFYGKIQSINTLLLPKFTYAFHAPVVPKYVLKSIENNDFVFLWIIRI